MAFTRAVGGILRSKVLIQQQALSKGGVAMMSTATHEAQVGDVPNIKPFEDIPGPGGLYKIPIIGSLLLFKPFSNMVPETVQIVIDKMFDKYGPIFKWQLGSTVVMVCDPKDLETVFRNEGKYPRRPSSTIGITYARRNNFRQSIVDLDGEQWHALRAPLNKRLMKVDSAHNYLQPQNVVADEFVDILTTQQMNSESLAEFFFCYASESIGVVCFNTRLGFLNADAMKNPETVAFLKASKDVFVYLHKTISGRSFTHDFYRNKIYRGYEEARLILRENTVKHIEKAKQVLEDQKRNGTLNPDEPNLLLSLLSDSTIAPEYVISIIETLYVAGTDSTAKNVQALFYNLATNPDKQQKLSEEIRRVIGQDQPLTSASLVKLNYLKACLKESFRMLYPTVSGTRRILPTDVILSGYRVPAGTIIGMHNPRSCKHYFSNPEKFIPERWLRSSEGHHQEEIPMTASLPFGYGPRNCIGRRFAEQEIYLAVAKVLQKLKIDVDSESSKTNFIYTLFVQPEKPIKFRFTELDD